MGSISLFAQPKDAVIEEIDGKKYYVHIVQAEIHCGEFMCYITWMSKIS